MPGGRAGGGGFRGGGGFSGGGFRGGGVSFRSSSPSSTPFGRTGAHRTTSTPPRGPYVHTPHHHPPPRYYGRWHWYTPWWRRRYYYGYTGYGYGGGAGGCVACCVCLVFVVVFAGIFVTADMWDGDYSYWGSGYAVNYRSTETLTYNDYWYEYESVKAGSQITFQVQSSPAKVSFFIWNKSFSNLPTKTATGSITKEITLAANEYKYEMLYLKSGSKINCTYNCSAGGLVDFIIMNGDNIARWDADQTYSSYYRKLDANNGSTTLSTSSTQDYYIVWYNDPGQPVKTVNYAINYTATGVYDYSAAGILYSAVAVNSVAQTSVTVPSDGQYYFYIFFDPMNSPEESTAVTFDVTYTPATGSTTAGSPWAPLLVVFIVIVVIGIIIAIVVSRRKPKVAPPPVATGAPSAVGAIPAVTPAPTKTPAPSRVPVKEVSLPSCTGCGEEIPANAAFCTSCGKKRAGRQIGTPAVTPPKKGNICSICGSKTEPDTNYCQFCGARLT